MDHYEQMSWDLENAQQERLRKSKGTHEEFWTEPEAQIFEEIKTFREKSSTYHPDNLR